MQMIMDIFMQSFVYLVATYQRQVKKVTLSKARICNIFRMNGVEVVLVRRHGNGNLPRSARWTPRRSLPYDPRWQRTMVFLTSILTFG